MIRRRFVELAAAYGALPFVGDEQSQQVLTRAIPSSGEVLPLIGMGTWITFDAGRSATARDRLRPVLQTFFDRGGRLVDSSPMYGTSETVVGDLLPKMTGRRPLFAASKVWIRGSQSQVGHMVENMGACTGRLPDARTRARMAAHFDNL